MCPLCGLDIEAGGEIWTLDDSGSGGFRSGQVSPTSVKLRWGHLECVRESFRAGRSAEGPIVSLRQLPRPLCPFYSKRGNCYQGADCFFVHEQGRVNLASMFGKGGRCGVFRRWLLTHPELRRVFSRPAPPRILDVAGGKGELAFELAALNGGNCVVVDPRCTALDEYERKLKQGAFHHNHAFLPFVQVPMPIGEEEHGAERCFRTESRRKINAAIASRSIYPGSNGNSLPPRRQRGRIDHVRLFVDQGLLDKLQEVSSSVGRELGNSDSVDRACSVEKSWTSYFNSQQQKIEGNSLTGDSTAVQRHSKVRGKLVKPSSPDDVEDAMGSTLSTSSSNSPFLRDSNSLESNSTQQPALLLEEDGLQPGRGVNLESAALQALELLGGEFDLVVGMHPDGAAEALVDYGLTFGVPFALVPCCTCSKDFPRRRIYDGAANEGSTAASRRDDRVCLPPSTTLGSESLSGPGPRPGGRLVRSYPDLVEYLRRKDPRIQLETLDFEGRNQVLWWTPPSTSL